MVREAQVSNKLRSIGVTATGISSLSRIGSSSTSSYRVDMRDSGDVITYLNNPEKDSVYSDWPRRLTSLLSPGHPQEVKLIARNVYDLIAVGDPATVDTLALVSRYPDLELLSYWSHLTTTPI